MRKIPNTLRDELDADPYMHECARAGPDCAGRITWEHVFIWAGRQINEKWSIIPLCWHHHLGDGLRKKINEAISLARATADDLRKYPRHDWVIQISNAIRLNDPHVDTNSLKQLIKTLK